MCHKLVQEETTIKEEIIVVECRIKKIVVYKNVHFFIQRDKVLHTHSALSANSTPPAENSSLTSTKQALNSLVNSSGLKAISSNTGNSVVRIADGEPDQNTLKVKMVAGESSGQVSATPSGLSKKKEHVEEHHQNVKEEKLTSEHNGREPVKEDHQKKKATENLRGRNNLDEAEKLSVIIFGTDSVSRLNMRRRMPRTFNFLMELGAVELTGYNKVGDNTFPNMVPIMSGFSRQELVNLTCLRKGGFYDDCPWIFKDFKSRGYVTAYAEVS